jgi:hypothetical protein
MDMDPLESPVRPVHLPRSHYPQIGSYSISSDGDFVLGGEDVEGNGEDEDVEDEGIENEGVEDEDFEEQNIVDDSSRQFNGRCRPRASFLLQL